MSSRIVRASFDEIRERVTGEVCLTCGAHDALPRPIPVSARADLRELDDYLLPVALCPDCRERLDRARRLRRIGLWLAVPLPLVAAVLVMALVPFGEPPSPLLIYPVAALASLGLFRLVRRRSAHKLPLLVLNGAGQVVTFRAAPRAAERGPAGAGPYRRGEPAPPSEPGPENVAVAGGSVVLAISLITGGAAMAYVFPQSYPLVILDNWSHTTYQVSIDGGPPIELEPQTERSLRLHHGPHTFSVHRPTQAQPERLATHLSWGGNRLLSVPGERCYAIERVSFVRANRFADHGTAYRYVQDISGRWIPFVDPSKVVGGPRGQCSAGW